ncbi:MAG: hypothetical protein FJ098_11410, partial [Deltaproteobacteria bacterium]|nr:hypothetical protein [Deltaproteobacteria bacterium]
MSGAQGSGLRDFAAWRGEGAASAFGVRYGAWRLSVLLEADGFDADGARLLEHARTAFLTTLGEAWSQIQEPASFLRRLLEDANRETWVRIRTNPVWRDRFVGVVLALTDGGELWLAQAGHGRVLGGDARGLRELLHPQTAAARMEEEGTIGSAAEAPEKLRSRPLQGLGLPPLDFAPRVKGPVPRASSGVLLLLSFAAGEAIHASEIPSFLDGGDGEEAGLGRLLDYCRARDPWAHVA